MRELHSTSISLRFYLSITLVLKNLGDVGELEKVYYTNGCIFFGEFTYNWKWGAWLMTDGGVRAGDEGYGRRWKGRGAFGAEPHKYKAKGTLCIRSAHECGKSSYCLPGVGEKWDNAGIKVAHFTKSLLMGEGKGCP